MKRSARQTYPWSIERLIMPKISTAVPAGSVTTPTRTSSHNRSIGNGADDILRTLVNGLGKKAVAAIFNKDVRTIDRWLKSTAGLGMDNERLLRDSFQIFSLVEEADDAHVARAWFLGMNPNLRDHSPIEVLAEGRAREVVAAARVFVNGA